LDLALARAVGNFNKGRAVAELLIEHGADPDGQYGSNYGPIVFVPCETLDPDGIQFLIDHGADVTFKPIDTKYGPASPLNGELRGATLLHMAIEFGEIEIAELLLDRGANINARSKITDGIGGQTPIFHAIASPQPDWYIRPLEFILKENSNWVDLSIKGTFKR